VNASVGRQRSASAHGPQRAIEADQGGPALTARPFVRSVGPALRIGGGRPRGRWVGAVGLVLASLILVPAGLIHAKDARRLPAGPVVTVHAPHPWDLELALDEVELDWTGDPGVKTLAPGRSATAIAGTRVVEQTAARAVVVVPGLKGPADLQAMAATLRAANPGAEAYLVLYEPGRPRSPSTRRLLTREVGLLLVDASSLPSVLAGLPATTVRPVTGVPGGYVVEAADPLAALSVAETLRQQPGVRSAYPLLRRIQVPR
jgi:hypothetical protein